MNINIKKSLFVALLSLASIVEAQVGVKNNRENPSVSNFPAESSVLDVYATQRGMFIPRINLYSRINPEKPVNLKEDMDAGKNVNGSMVFHQHIGDPTKDRLEEGYYIWVNDAWHLVLRRGEEPQTMLASVPKAGNVLTQISNGQRPDETLQLANVINNIDGAAISNGEITLPKGVYHLRYTADLLGMNSKNSSGAYFGNAFQLYAFVVALRKKDGTLLSTEQRISKIADKKHQAFLSIEGSFIFVLTEPTTIKQTIRYDDGSTHSTGVTTRTEWAVSITKVANDVVKTDIIDV